MVVSDKHKYVFIELPLTGSTALSSELCDQYDGEKILKKHSRYHEFLRIATPEQKKYFTFSGIRNPLDFIVSEFLKIKSNHKGRYTNAKEWRKNGGTLSNKNLLLYDEITSKNMSFQDYFLKYYKLPYDNWSNVAHDKFDYIVRFENLQTDFFAALRKLGIEPKRELPKINKTSEKEDFTKYFTPEIRKHAVFVFGPFMKKWGYEFPGDWEVRKPGFVSFTLFNIMGIVRKIYWSNTDSKSGMSKPKTESNQKA